MMQRFIQKSKVFLKNYFRRLNTGIRRPVPMEKLEEIILQDSGPSPVWPNIILFLLTVLTTTYAGAHTGNNFLTFFLSGFSYSITLLAILLSHEFGHYFAARAFGIRATLPYFIPLPFPPVGTMGAVIKTRSPLPHRRALLYVGAMGPLPGFLVSLAASIAGIYLSEIKPLPPAGGELPLVIFGDSLLYGIIVRFFHGVIPVGYDVFPSPYAWAGWIGFLITGLNLMPLGQLDGGHILYALIGPRQRYFGWVALAMLIILSFFFPGWLFWIAATLLFLMVAHPPVESGPELSTGEKALGWFCMLIFILTFIPVPVRFL